MIGQIVGNYKIESKLGEGGMGAVYKGVDTMLDREVAIKALRPELASQNAIVERFRSEAVTLAKLSHPNIATLYTMFRQGEELYMVLEFVRGETLDSILQKRGALSAEEAIPVFCQVMDGIDHAHEYGIIHRDIKPANMMLTEKGTLKVLDFGIARLLGSTRMTRAGNIIGTLEYMAPEQVKGLETDARSDIYALGMMLYEVLTGRTPFDTENEFQLMMLQTETMPPPPRQINPSIPEAVEAAIMKSIAKNPDERFQTAGEFRDALLDAGFASSGAMRGTTGSYMARTNTRPSNPPVSQPGTARTEVLNNMPQSNVPKATRLGAPAAAPPKPSIKETRLGANAATAAPAFASTPKATRLGAVGATAATAGNMPSASQSSPSFFSKLTIVHYAGAAVAAIFLIGLMSVAAFMLLVKSKVAESKPATEVVKPAEKPAIIDAPKVEQPAVSTVAPAQSITSQGTGTLTPTDSKTGDLTLQPDTKVPKSTDKPAEKPRETVAQKPAAPKPAAPAAKKPAAKKPSAECLLTGNC
ncbi:MAG: protein kinase [Acidobacteriota bacterium]|nr:protein kinase [Acidobacteriota bacterium]